MSLTEPLLRHNTLDGERHAQSSPGRSDRGYVQLVMAGCVVFWIVVGALVFASF